MEQIYDSFDVIQVVTEMGSGASTLVPLSPETVQEITEGDDDPVFATFIVEGGWSKNRRLWPDNVIQSIVEEVNRTGDPVVGYMGHIKPEEEGFSFPDIQLQWVKGVLQPSSEKVRMLIKGYVLPGTKARDYIKRRLIRGVSVAGDAELAPVKGGVQVKEFVLKSIDLSRPRNSGMRTALVGVTSEMEGGNSVKPEEIAALQENELRAHNPKLVETIETEAKKPLETKITEMENSEQTEEDELAKIRQALEVDENADILDVISKLLAKTKEAGKTLREKVLDDVLGKKFKDENTRSLVRRILVSEMEGVSEDDPDFEKKLTENINTTIDGDEELRKYVSEQTGGGTSLPPRTDGKREGKKTEYEKGHEDEFVAVT